MSRTPKALDMESYDIGYRDGENSAHADWFIALEEALPDDVDPDDVTPAYVSKFLADRCVRILDCNAADLHDDPHVWDFGSGEHFVCLGTPGGHIPAPRP